MAAPLASAGLGRITVSMDAVDPATFARITRVPDSFAKVLAGVRAAQRAGLGPVKVNCVLLRGFNDDQIVPFARFSRDEGVIVRFIEFMPLEEDRMWTREVVVPLDEVVARLSGFARWWPFPQKTPVKPHAAIPSTMASGKSASSRPYRSPFAAPAAASVSPPTAKSAPVSSPISTTISMASWRVGGPMTISHGSFGGRSSQGGPPPHRRARLSKTFTQHGSYRRLNRAFSKTS